jgi:hypothetical protein
MTKAHDIDELIAESSSGTAERHALEAAAVTLHESLTRAVPARPEFKARLRQQLVAEARRTLMPWYRRPAVWGTSVSVAAAAAVLAIGLQVYRGGPHSDMAGAGPTGPLAPLVTDAPPIPIPDQTFKSFYVNQVKVPAIVLPDEVIPPGQVAPAPDSVAGLDLSQGLKVFVLGSLPDMAQFTRIASGLGFTQKPQRSGIDFTLTAGRRTINMTADGEVLYIDQSNGQDPGAVTDAAGAQLVARRFLDTAGLPVPDLQPTVSAVTEGGQRIFTVSYTPRVEGRPIVNARTVIIVSDRSRVLEADAYVYAREQDPTWHPVISPEAALAEATKRDGGRFGGDVDLVYVRTVSDQTVYLQPSWRVFGTGDQGARLMRYVPAVAPE